MIFGITLKRFAKLLQQGDAAKTSKRTERLLIKKSNKVFKSRSLSEMRFSDFVDLERHFTDLNYTEFCRIFVQKRFWQTVYIHNMWAILEDYSKQKEQLFENYPYIFDPPQYGEPGKETVGSELRKDFVAEFGNWVILTDVICKGRLVDYKVVEGWKVSEFLFWANYLSGQKIIENVK